MAQQWEVAQASASGSTPSLESFVQLVMPAPPVDLSELSTGLGAPPAPLIETRSLVDSPDDAFVSHSPVRVGNLSPDISTRLQEFIDTIQEQLGSVGDGVSEDAPFARYGVARREAGSEISVWVEARDADMSAYYLPRIDLVRDPSLRWRTPHLGSVQPEKFFAGPVRIIAYFDAVDGTLRGCYPWLSSQSVAEAEEHFARRIRSGDSADASWIGDEVMDQLFREVCHRGEVERNDAPLEKKYEWLDSLGKASIVSVGVDTVGRRLYSIQFAEVPVLRCAVALSGETNGTIDVRATLL